MSDGGQEIEGVVTESLPSGMYRVELDPGGSVVAHVAAEMRLRFTRILPGERVKVKLSQYDGTRGRITYRFK